MLITRQGTLKLLTCSLVILSSPASLAKSTTVHPSGGNKVVAASVTSRVENLYKQGQYAEALTLVQTTLDNPAGVKDLHDLGTMHYMKANILIKQGQEQAARVEYALAIQMAPDAATRAYCENAILIIDKAVNRQGADSAAEIGHEANMQASTIQRQGAQESARVRSDNAHYQAVHSAKTSAITTRMASEGSYDADGNWYPAYTQGQINDVQYRRQAREAQRADIAARQSVDLQTSAQAKAQATEESAEGLSNLLAAPTRAGEAALNPEGTNLFVRNYTVTNSSPTAAGGAKGPFKIGQQESP